MTQKHKQMKFNRNMILNILSENIQIMNKKVNGRIKNPENEKIKINQMKAVVYACKVYSDILKEQQIDEFKRELEIIKNAVEHNKNQENIKEDLEVVESTMKELTDYNK